MKSIYVFLIKVTFLFGLTSLSQAGTIDDKLYTSSKYPYDLLMARTNKIKIIYSEGELKVRCKVEVNWLDEVFTSEQIIVVKEQFKNRPLASCLARDSAKSILAKTFTAL